MRELDLGRQPWMDDAACRQLVNPDLFFCDPTTSPGAQYTRDAKDICATCSVIDACLAYALELGEVDGVWGGTTKGERRQITARRRTKGTCA